MNVSSASLFYALLTVHSQESVTFASQLMLYEDTELSSVILVIFMCYCHIYKYFELAVIFRLFSVRFLIFYFFLYFKAFLF